MKKLYLFLIENNNFMKDLSKYFGVGIIAAITEWTIFFSLFSFKINYIICVIVAFLFATGVNYYFSSIIFKTNKFSKSITFTLVYFVSAIGLLLNILIMWLLFDLMNLYSLLSKIIATGIVFFWNFITRKYWIYKN